MDETLWRRSFENFPSYGCPRCKGGKLAILTDTLKRVEARYAEQEHNEKGYHPYNDVTRFVCLLQCSRFSCGEVVAVSGDIDADVEYLFGADGHEEEYTNNKYLPRSMFPAPPVVRLPKKLPQECSDHLNAAFGLMWADTGACANRIRTFTETLLDHFQIDRKGPDKNGKIYRFNLSQRIKLFEAKKPGHQSLYEALRIVGNVGSHSGVVSWDIILKAFRLVDYLIEILIEDKGAAMRALAQEIIDGNEESKP